MKERNSLNDGQPARTYCTAQVALLPVTWKPGWEGSLDTWVCMTEALQHAPETITALFNGYTSI